MFRWPKMTWRGRLSRRQLILMGAVLVIATTGLMVWRRQAENLPETKPVETPMPQPVQVKADTSENKPTTKSPVAVTPSPNAVLQPTRPHFMFGVGTELDQDLHHPITKDAPIKLLTSWYNGSKDLGFMNGWRKTIVPKAYAAGYALHLIIYSNDPEQNLNTAYGSACGRPYPLSVGFLDDMRQLAKDFAGGKLYVSMFTELQTYPCNDNQWSGSDKYYRALKDQYLASIKIFHQTVPGSQISLSWGGWQAEWDDVEKGGGRSLFKRFADVMNASDFQSFQAMANNNNLTIINDMTKALSPYKGGVMVAHYKPDGGSQTTFNADIKDIFTPSRIALLQQNGLFAFSFMDTNNMNGSNSTYQTVKKIIKTYTR